MTPLKFASCLFMWLGAFAADVQLSVRQEGGFKSANAGDRVTLRCFHKGNAALFLWYKQPLGQKPLLVSTLYKYDQAGTFTGEFRNNSRFSLETKNSSYHLTMSDLHISDSGTYYCVSCNAYKYEFAEGATVSVKGSGWNVPVLVHQSASGDSVTLNCTVHTGTCDGEHSVYWFRESHPGIIYTHRSVNHQCERKPDAQTHTCVYKLPNKSLNVSHAGTDYCAVASCGRVLFGNGNKLDSQDDVDSFVPVYLLSAALAFTGALAVLLTFSVYRIHKANSCKCADPQARFSAHSTVNAEVTQDADNIHYAALREQRFSRARRQQDNAHCVYSTIKH